MPKVLQSFEIEKIDPGISRCANWIIPGNKRKNATVATSD